MMSPLPGMLSPDLSASINPVFPLDQSPGPPSSPAGTVAWPPFLSLILPSALEPGVPSLFKDLDTLVSGSLHALFSRAWTAFPSSF